MSEKYTYKQYPETICRVDNELCFRQCRVPIREDGVEGNYRAKTIFPASTPCGGGHFTEGNMRSENFSVCPKAIKQLTKNFKSDSQEGIYKIISPNIYTAILTLNDQEVSNISNGTEKRTINS